jgi:hypothetical protein
LCARFLNEVRRIRQAENFGRWRNAFMAHGAGACEQEWYVRHRSFLGKSDAQLESRANQTGGSASFVVQKSDWNSAPVWEKVWESPKN